MGGGIRTLEDIFQILRDGADKVVINTAATKDPEFIFRASQKFALSAKFKEICDKVKNPYGNGKAYEKIVRFLENLQIDKNLLIKKLMYDI